MDKIKQKSSKITLSALAVGALVAPIQSAVSHIDFGNSPDNSVSKIQVDHHPHPSDPGSWQNHYIDPRSIRAVGHDTGKDSEKNSRPDTWDVYNARAA